MHRPKDVSQALGVSPTTLRRWCATFADHLSPTAGAAISETGGPAQRRFSDDDLALLAAIKRELAGGRTVGEVQVRLQRGDLPPARDVVVGHDDAATRHPAPTEPPTGASSGAVALVAYQSSGGSDAGALVAAWADVARAFPDMTEALRGVESATTALAEAQRELAEELRRERAALEAARQATAATRPTTLWGRIRGVFTERA